MVKQMTVKQKLGIQISSLAIFQLSYYVVGHVTVKQRMVDSKLIIGDSPICTLLVPMGLVYSTCSMDFVYVGKVLGGKVGIPGRSPLKLILISLSLSVSVRSAKSGCKRSLTHFLNH
jgi:hypothetical protein